MAGFLPVREGRHCSWHSGDEFRWSNHRSTSRRLPRLLSGSPDSKCRRTNCSTHLATDSDVESVTVDFQARQTFGCTANPIGPSRAHPRCFGEEYCYS